MAVTFLPADNSYSSLYRLYSDNFDEDSDYNISLSTFHRVWKKYVPEIKCKKMRFSSKYWAVEKKVNE